MTENEDVGVSASRAESVKAVLRKVGYEPLHWTRVMPYRECEKVIAAMNPESLDVLEISAGHHWQKQPFRSFTEMNYPEHDICTAPLPDTFDLIIADNVFEHLLYPYRAARHVLQMLRPGGTFLCLTPFLIKYHAVPIDCSRWTETGIRHLLIEAGFDDELIRTDSWGNKACVKANLKSFVRRGWFGSLRNEPEFPVTVWVFAQKGGRVD